jgi:methyl-accepting chemotaxis protein
MNKANYVDDTPVPVIVMDREHNIEYLNPAAALMAGVTQEACVGRKLWEVFDVEACRNGSCPAAHAMRDGRTQTGADDCVVKGRTLPIQGFASPRYDDQNRLIGAVEVIQDESVRKNAVVALTEFAKGNYEFELKDADGKKAVSIDPIERLRANVKSFIDEIKKMSAAHEAGDIDAVIPEERFEGSYRAMAKGVNDMVMGHISVKKKAMACVKQFGEGNFEAELEKFPGKKAFINETIEQVRSNLKALIVDTDLLVDAALAGKLDTRADASKHQGDFRKIVQGVNDTLDAVIRPLNVAAGYVDRISKGDIPEKITDSYNGDFNLIKNNLNQCIDGLGALREATAVTQRMTVNDYTKGVDGNYLGIFADLAAGINGGQERVRHVIDIAKRISRGNMEELAELKKVGKRSENDELLPSFILMMESIGALVADAEMLTKAAVEGKLETRADASKHHGDFRKVVQGLNNTLDSVIGPLNDVSAILSKLAGGDFTALVTSKYAGDFDVLANAVNTLSKSVRSALEQIGRNVSALASSSEELNKVSQSMGSSADETATQASVVSAAAEQVSNNVQTVATGADEMSASIKEIAKNTAEATRVASSAVRTAEVTNETISKLGQSSAEIGQVIKVITSIAQQTNLLALNATIEAARAGEAGKGFAVVANEVKELAKETAKATEDISRKIEAIQGDTNGAVSAINQISQVIGQISDIQTTIASAIEEQSATTNEIGRTLAEAAKGSTDISKNIGGVAEAARATTVGATDTSKSALSLEKMAGELQTLVSQFRY